MICTPEIALVETLAYAAANHSHLPSLRLALLLVSSSVVADIDSAIVVVVARAAFATCILKALLANDRSDVTPVAGKAM